MRRMRGGGGEMVGEATGETRDGGEKSRGEEGQKEGRMKTSG